MPGSSDKWEKISMCCAVCGAVVLFFIGLQLVITGVYVNSQDEFQTLNNMILADLGSEEEWKPSPDMFMWVFIVVGPVIMVAACLGCFGAVLQTEACVCPYFFFTLTGAMCFAIVLVINTTFGSTLDGVVERQADSYCSPTTYPVFKDHLCGAGTAECNEDCVGRVALLKTMRGCTTLTNMCDTFEFEKIDGEGLCTVGGEIPITWVGQAADGKTEFDAEACKKICNEHTACSGVAYSMLYTHGLAPLGEAGTCFIVSTAKPTAEALAWLEISDSKTNEVNVDGVKPEAGVLCFKKDNPAFLAWGEWLTKIVEEACWVAIIAIVCITSSSCAILFTLTTRRKGKKGAFSVCMRMLCPCCIPKTERKFPLEEDPEDEEYLVSDGM